MAHSIAHWWAFPLGCFIGAAAGYIINWGIDKWDRRHW